MQTWALNCNECGAPLEVAAGTKFVTCRQCGTRLTVVQTTTSLFTEIQEHSPSLLMAGSPHTTIRAAGASAAMHTAPELTMPLPCGRTADRPGQQRGPAFVASAFARFRGIWRVPFFWLCLSGFLTAIAASSDTIETRRTAIVLGGPLLLLTGGWTVFWLGQSSFRGFQKGSAIQGWVLAAVTVASSIGLLVLGAFIVTIMGFAMFYRQ